MKGREGLCQYVTNYWNMRISSR